MRKNLKEARQKAMTRSKRYSKNKDKVTKKYPRKLQIVIKIQWREALVSDEKGHLLNQYIKKVICPIYEEYPYAQVRIEVDN